MLVNKLLVMKVDMSEIGLNKCLLDGNKFVLFFIVLNFIVYFILCLLVF